MGTRSRGRPAAGRCQERGETTHPPERWISEEPVIDPCQTGEHYIFIQAGINEWTAAVRMPQWKSAESGHHCQRSPQFNPVLSAPSRAGEDPVSRDSCRTGEWLSGTPVLPRTRRSPQTVPRTGTAHISRIIRTNTSTKWGSNWLLAHLISSATASSSKNRRLKRPVSRLW